MSFNTFYDWLQFAAALATILAAPWIVDLLKFAFRKNYVAEFKPAVLLHGGQTMVWTVNLRNETGVCHEDVISLYPKNRRAKVREYQILNREDSGVHVHSEIEHGVVHISPGFWAKSREIEVQLIFDRPASPLAHSRSHPIKMRWILDKTKLISSGYLIFIAQIRVIWIALQFLFLSILCIGRVAYLGIANA